MNKPVVFFDGVCNLCNHSVQFIISRDPNGQFYFASLQSDFAKKHLPEKMTEELNSMIFWEQGKYYDRSTAILKVAQKLGYPWKLLYVFYFIPRPIRDAVYAWIAKNRYRWFGRKDQCMLPTPDLKKRFIDE
ncbi:thiol-disulfide oxidoreductase DCC family protein [Hazenella sp. IB182357]|uniref:Thiol-disulfide oxidoreductase DCC family protein n=1 Tax=Polycladospora coralii TaxID=2771432 RepID=A0A926N6V4_9BACL|nr:thiol-disulfide oxidoreductase DCC family protein [Polycladospora coralii]MBD1372806.1 thiol-disulfide oxidoreductase DCC family protein [Polycladospora coralii]MBS7529496.1 thiol-disulfide oxidoreductase DCC family protein [Polycladospora coralii]